jgi:hypothetical protein
MSIPDSRLLSSDRLQHGHHEPPFRPSTVELLGGEARASPQIGKVALRGARPDTDASRRIANRPASRDERGEDINLSGSARSRKLASKPVSHARHPAAASHSSRPSIGMMQV